MTTSNWTISGMTCDHCAASVTEEVSEVTGVTRVDVDRPAGTMVVESTDAIDPALITAAVAEAGNYTATAS
ncbi:heavy-metal-associated domain-containing protein [Propionibacteriaceae bacterium Y2011]|uniref:heavy-metal-associated domain-containing protein n=1 Tax=Microlunatus sp. Y2014 TaxID=3418488 RepID=UPI003B4AD6D5